MFSPSPHHLSPLYSLSRFSFPSYSGFPPPLFICSPLLFLSPSLHITSPLFLLILFPTPFLLSFPPSPAPPPFLLSFPSRITSPFLPPFHFLPLPLFLFPTLPPLFYYLSHSLIFAPLLLFSPPLFVPLSFLPHSIPPHFPSRFIPLLNLFSPLR